MSAGSSCFTGDSEEALTSFFFSCPARGEEELPALGDFPPVGVLALLVVGEEEEASGGGVVAVLVVGEAPSSLLLLGEGGLSIKALEEFQSTS